MGSSSKKGNSDATRAERKAKKRKLEDAIPDLPGEEVVAEEKPKKRKRSADEDVVEEKAAKKEKKSKTDKDVVEDEDKEARKAAKKAKKALKAEQSGTAAVELAVQEPVAEEEAPKKSKKERKAERKAKEAAETAAVANGTAAKDAQGAKDPTSKEEVDGDAEQKKSKKNNRNRAEKRKRDAAAKESGEEGGKAARFICFIGRASGFHSFVSILTNCISKQATYLSARQKSLCKSTSRLSSPSQSAFSPRRKSLPSPRVALSSNLMGMII